MDEDVLKDLLASDPTNDDVAEALAKVLSEKERWEDLSQLLLDRLDHNTGSRVHHYRRLAEVMDVHLDSPDKAFLVLLEGLRECKDDALLGDPLADLADKLNQWPEILNTYEMLLEESSAPLSFHRRLADWYARLNDLPAEVFHRRAILENDPSDHQAADALFAYYETTEDWQNLAQLIELKLKVCSVSERAPLILSLAQLFSTSLDRGEDALKLVAQLFIESPSIELRETMESYAEASDCWAHLATAYEHLSDSTLGGFDSEADKHQRLAELYASVLSDPKQARRHYAAALTTGTWDPKLAAAYRTLLRDAEDLDALIERIDTDLKHIEDEEHRYDLFLEKGTMCQQQGKLHDAIDAWLAALVYQPDNKAVLIELMDAFRNTQQWTSSIKVLKKLTVVEAEPERRAQYYYAIGVIERDKLEDSRSAARSFDQALEFDPRFVRAFHAIDELLTAEGNHERRDRYYRKMLVRSVDNELDADLITMIARQLGDLNRRHLDNYEAALSAYEVALTHGDADRSLFKIVAELEAKTGNLDAAEETLLSLIESDPGDSECLHALVTLYSTSHKLDQAYCVCRVLKLLGHASSDEIALYQSVLENTKGRQVRPMKADTWQQLESTIQNAEVGQILKFLTPALLDYVSRTERAVGVSNHQTEGLKHVQRLVALVAAILGRPTPEVRLSSRVEGVAIGHLAQPILVASSDLSKLSRSEQIICATRAFVLLQPSYYLATLDRDAARSTARLTKLLATVHQWLEPDRPQPQAMPELLTLLESVSESDKQAFLEPMAILKRHRDYGIAEWLDSVDQMITRLAFAIADDLEAAVNTIRRDRTPIGSATVQDRIVNLVSYSTSGPYYALRTALALTVQPK
ncbi:MAG: hypothetical protein CMH52_01400 [Myxococcales bacterium]|nr:hypothetical protein [Myxococcales bacterium]